MRTKEVFVDHRVHTRKVDRGVAKVVAGDALHRMIKHHEFSNKWRILAGRKEVNA